MLSHKNQIYKKSITQKVIEDVLLIVPIPDNIQVIIEVQRELPKFMADYSMLKRILTNLVQNAVQALPKGGKLTISAYPKERQVRISVEDTGVGIPEEVKPKLFTPMVTTKAKGQGLGLVVAKRLIEAQGGTITFESQDGEGKGISDLR